MNGLSTTFKALMETIMTASSSRYKATLHSGANRPTPSTTVYAATGLSELGTTANNAYVTGGTGLTGGISLTSVLSSGTMTFANKTLTTASGESITNVDTIAIWDTSTVNSVTNGLVAIIDLLQYTTAAGVTTSGQPTITFPSASTLLSVGFPITGSGIPASTTITAISGSTVTMSANATATASSVSMTAGFGTQTASNGGTFTLTFASATVTFTTA